MFKLWQVRPSQVKLSRFPKHYNECDCRDLISNSFCKLQPIYDEVKQGSIILPEEQEEVFIQIKADMLSAPALALPDQTKPLTLFCHEVCHQRCTVLNLSRLLPVGLAEGEEEGAEQKRQIARSGWRRETRTGDGLIISLHTFFF